MKLSMKLSKFRRFSSIFLTLLFATCSYAGTDKIYTGFFSDLAVGGYDVVAYFDEGSPVKGNPKYHLQLLDAEWRFKNQANLLKFEAEPERYMPQYGGYCAWAVSQGNTAKGDPRFWRIVEGKLYLNYDDDVQKTWESDIPGFIESADKNWPSLLSE